jgi:hypothetical protein
MAFAAVHEEAPVGQAVQVLVVDKKNPVAQVEAALAAEQVKASII